MSAEYSFTTLWHLDAEIERVWQMISHSTDWPSWWKGVESVTELEVGDEAGVGSLQRHIWKSVLPYRVTFDLRVTDVEAPHLLSGSATGELVGEGRWSLFEGANQTTVRYEWNVRTTRVWMNVAAPAARPVFAWNHDVVMGDGGRCLARRLGTRLL